MSGAPIGLFDSGVGGLSIWRQVVHALPSESLLYVADQANVPYGHRSADEIQANSLGIADYLVAQGCKAIVVACNTASAVALEPLRQRFPQLPILGLEPAVKPAVQLTRSGVVGVMATPATFQGQLYRATVGRYATAVQVVEQVCVGLAELVEGTGAALMFEPGNATQLADRIHEVLTDPDLAASMRERARELVESSYSWAAIARRTEEWYRDALGS